MESSEASIQHPRLESLATASDVAGRCADVVAEVLREVAEPALLLPAGATPVPVYAELVRRQARGEIDLRRAHLFQLDELIGVGPDDPRSFQHFLREHLLKHLGSSDRLHLLDGTSPEPSAAIYEHAAKLERLGGADMALLGIGRNGHIAFNEPGSDLDAPARQVALAEPTRSGLAPAFDPGPPPTHGITLGMHEIHAARRIALIATGASKAKILLRLLREAPGPKLPASLLCDHPGFVLLADEVATSLT